ncbi:hypothetical protein [Clostridium perfringens]|uniref:hypothetical protein n=1 Tax=Clostridium perfringens TaxID=1502 RepID=UPI001A2CCA82|nr:hypothetical protein [Clostridium perfringens]MCX0399168.1 hypothetical protein [Clostridium perfringens]HAT4332201.1 hypothetical protein [Clostridium perfringens]
MSKYEKALDEVLGRQFDLCKKMDCESCCVLKECIRAFGNTEPDFLVTKEKFAKKIKEELLLPWEE